MRSAFLKANSKGILSISLFIIPPNQPDAHFVDIYIKLVVLKKKKKLNEILETVKLRRCMFCLLYRKQFLTGLWLSNHWLEFSVIDYPRLPFSCSRAVLQCACRAWGSASTQETKEMCVERKKNKTLWIMTTVLKSRHKAAEEIWAFRNHLICLLWCRFPASRAWMRSGVFWGAKQDVNMEI